MVLTQIAFKAKSGNGRIIKYAIECMYYVCTGSFKSNHGKVIFYITPILAEYLKTKVQNCKKANFSLFLIFYWHYLKIDLFLLGFECGQRSTSDGIPVSISSLQLS